MCLNYLVTLEYFKTLRPSLNEAFSVNFGLVNRLKHTLEFNYLRAPSAVDLSPGAALRKHFDSKCINNSLVAWSSCRTEWLQRDLQQQQTRSLLISVEV